jgi:predicted dehydrogenase
MKVAVLGLGSIGRRHGRNFRALGLDGIIGFDPSEERRAQFTQETGAPATGDQAAAIAASDLVCVCSPNRFHTAQALAAAHAGKGLFIEKPMGVERQSVAELRLMVEDKGLFAHVGSNWKFHPAFQMMKRLLADGAVGRIVAVQVLAGQWLPDWHPWEDYRQMYSSHVALGGGIVLDSHEFDYLSWLFGPVAEVRGMTRRSGALEIDTEDAAVALLRFDSGVLGSVQVDYIQREYRRSYHVCGDAGTLEWNYRTNQIRLYRAANQSVETFDVGLTDINEMYLAQARHLIAGMGGTETPVTSIRQAEAVIDILLRIKDGQ